MERRVSPCLVDRGHNKKDVARKRNGILCGRRHRGNIMFFYFGIVMDNEDHVLEPDHEEELPTEDGARRDDELL